ncbi:hypothetical protein PT2222_50144 [Paraburkholderia tropica]
MSHVGAPDRMGVVARRWARPVVSWAKRGQAARPGKNRCAKRL